MKIRDQINRILDGLDRKNLDSIASEKGVSVAMIERERLINEGIDLLKSYRKTDLNK